jgi:hypothetical protein
MTHLHDTYVDLNLSHPASDGGWYARNRRGDLFHTYAVPDHPHPGRPIRVRQVETVRQLPGLCGA